MTQSTVIDTKNASTVGRRRRYRRAVIALLGIVLMAGLVSWIRHWRFETQIVQAGGKLVIDTSNTAGRSGFVRIRNRVSRVLSGVRDPRPHHIQFLDVPLGDEWLSQHRNAIEKLSQQTWLTLEQTQVTSDGLAALQGVRGVWTVNLSGTPLKDDALEHLATMPDLLNLDISRTGISDRALVVLKQFPALEWVSVDARQATETGIQHLAEIPQLATLCLVEPTPQIVSLLPYVPGLVLKEGTITLKMIDTLQKMDRLGFVTLIACKFGGTSEQQLRDTLPDCRVTVITAETVSKKKQAGAIY